MTTTLKQRRRALEAANAQARTCQRKAGAHPCGGVLYDHIDRTLGRVVRRCPLCERREAGICRDCPRPVYGAVGKALRCALHADLVRKASIARWAREHRDLVLAKARAAYADPVVREKRNAYKRLWRKAHRDKVAQQKRRAAIRHNAAREKMLRYHRKYNAERRQAKAEAQRLKSRSETPAPLPRCVECGRDIPGYAREPGVMENRGRPPKRCVHCADPRDVKASVLRWAARTDRELTAPPATPRRVKPWRPRQQETRHNAAGERLCWTAGCTRVVRSRTKKCDACKAEELRLAASLLSARSGAEPRRVA